MADVPPRPSSQVAPALVVVIEGPPRSGKTTIRRRLREYWDRQLRWCATCAVGDQVKQLAHTMLGLAVPPDRYEAEKDEPHPDFRGKSPRHVYIEVSEFARGLFGPDFFARLAVQQVRDRLVTMGAHTLLLDAGVEDEVAHVLRELGRPPTCVLAVRRPLSGAHDYRQPIDLGLPRVVVEDAINARIEQVAIDILQAVSR